MKRAYFVCLFQFLTTCGVLTLAVLSTLLLIAARPAQAQTETVLYNFTDTPDGSVPQGGVIFDAAGNLYGTTTEGGTDGTGCAGGCGTVFELTPGTNGWTETTLHSFVFNGTDGVVPRAGLIFDAAGNLYGTTANGGTSGVGIVFELSPGPSGTWTEKILLNFNYSNGTWPWATLIFDAGGNLYGTARGGGAYNGGTVFELLPGPNGTWTEKTLHNFGKLRDGVDARGMIFGADGNLYGVTAFGGSYNMGTVFELSPGAKGAWTEKILHSFNGKNGYEPWFGNLLFDAAGNLYGTTIEGGLYDQGVVFQLTKGAKGTWTERILFDQDGGGYLIFDKTGNLYGTITSWGLGWGSIFRLTEGTNGKWTETELYYFEGWPDGSNPFGTLIFDAGGNLYGTTACGGSDGSGTGSGCGGLGYGTVFELTNLPAVTRSTLTSSPNPSTLGQAVTFTAVVTPTPPDGETVSLMQGKTVLRTGALSGGVASFATSTLKIGTHSITAVYGGDSNFTGSTSRAVNQVVE